MKVSCSLLANLSQFNDCSFITRHREWPEYNESLLRQHLSHFYSDWTFDFAN